MLGFPLAPGQRLCVQGSSLMNAMVRVDSRVYPKKSAETVASFCQTVLTEASSCLQPTTGKGSRTSVVHGFGVGFTYRMWFTEHTGIICV